MDIIKKIGASLLSAIMAFQLSACGLSETAQNAANTAMEKAGEAKDSVVAFYSQIDMDAFRNGWDKAVDFATSKYSASVAKGYVDDVGVAIEKLKVDINSSFGSKRSTASEAGFLAEKWTADTFNIDAVAGCSAYSANVVGSNGMGSVDVSTSYGENASLKYYNTAKGSASAQATSILEEYNKYKNKSNNPISLDEYLDKYTVNKDDLDALYKSIYDGQTRIIPSDQYDEAVAFLKSKQKTFSEFDAKNSSNRVSARSKTYTETLENLKTRLEAPDGTKSTPATYEQMQAMAELAQKGEFDPSAFGISTSKIITPKYIVKQAVNSGISSATINTALTLGPDIFTIAVQAAKDGKFDEKQLQNLGIDGLLSASEGFFEGSVSYALLAACKAGKLGKDLTNVSPDVVGTLTVILIDSIRFGYSLSKGEITPLDYSNLMAEEVLVSVTSLAAGVAVQTLLAGVPLAYMAGSMAGGILASVGFHFTKELILEIKDGGGFEAIVPQGAINTMNVITDTVANINITDQLTEFKDMTVSTAKNGFIKIKSVF